MVWRRDYSRDEVIELLAALEQQVRDAVALAERAQRDIDTDRFATFLDFRRKVEEVRALVALTEERLGSLPEDRLGDLRQQFEALDLLLTGMLAKASRSYFTSMRDDQVLPLGAREMFTPELKVIEELRSRLSRPQYADKVPPEIVADLDGCAEKLRRLISRAPSLPDFGDSPTPPKPMKRLRNLGRPIRT